VFACIANARSSQVRDASLTWCHRASRDLDCLISRTMYRSPMLLALCSSLPYRGTELMHLRTCSSSSWVIRRMAGPAEAAWRDHRRRSKGAAWRSLSPQSTGTRGHNPCRIRNVVLNSGDSCVDELVMPSHDRRRAGDSHHLRSGIASSQKTSR